MTAVSTKPCWVRCRWTTIFRPSVWVSTAYRPNGFTTPDAARGVAVQGQYAYVADNDAGLQVIRVSNPAEPSIVGTRNTPDDALDVAVQGDYAYVADDASGLQVIDITVPTNPRIVGAVDTPGFALGIAVAGTLACVSADEAGLQVIDISDPTDPQIVGEYNTPGASLGVAMGGSMAYVADDEAGLLVIDIADPTVPQLVGGYNTPGNAEGVILWNDQVYVADRNDGLFIFEAQCGGITPVKMLSFTASVQSGSVRLDWTTASEVNHSGFHVYRKSLGDSWTRLSRALITGGPEYTYRDLGIEPGGRYEYAVESWSRSGETERFGPVEITLSLPAGVTLTAAPNPAPGDTRIRFSTAVAGPVTLRVFDLSGRLIRSLVEGSETSGDHEVVWNGRTDSGHRAPAGIYFLKLDTVTSSKLARVTVIR